MNFKLTSLLKYKKTLSFTAYLKSIGVCITASSVALASYAASDADNLIYLARTQANLNGNLFNDKNKSNYGENDEESSIYGNGLNLSLIAQMNECYAKELLELLASTQNGEISSSNSRYHLTVGTLLGLRVAETGVYGNTKYIPKSYLPYASDTIYWNKSYATVPANKMLLNSFTKTEYNIIANSGYDYSGLDNRMGVTAYQFERENKLVTLSSKSKTGVPDSKFEPDILAQVDATYNDAIKQADISPDRLTERALACLISTNHNRGAMGLFYNWYGLPYQQFIEKINYKNASEDEKIKVGSQIAELFDSYLNNQPAGSDYSAITDIEGARWAAAIIAAHTDGWYVSEDIVNNAGGKSVAVTVWQKLYPEDNIKSGADASAFLKKKNKTLANAIKEVTGTKVTVSDTQRVYGTSCDYSDANYNSNKRGYLFHVTKEQSNTYNNSYSDGTVPYLVQAYDFVNAGHCYCTSVIGDLIFANLLVIGGVEGVDPTNPDTYRNSLNSQDGGGYATYNVQDKDIPEAFLGCGINAKTLSQIRLKILKEAAFQVLNSDYSQSNRHYATANQRGLIDCSYLAWAAYYLAGFTDLVYINSKGYETSSQVTRIAFNQLKPGDIVATSGIKLNADGTIGQSSLGGHVMIYLGQTAEGCHFAEAKGVKSGCGVSCKKIITKEDATGDRLVEHPGPGNDTRIFTCYRYNVLEAAEAREASTYVPPANKGNYVIAVTQSDKDLMYDIVAYEAQGEIKRGKIAIAEVIINRINSPKYGNTVSEICNSSWNAGLTPQSIANKFESCSSTTQAEIMDAVEIALCGSNEVDGALYFRTLHYHTFGTPVCQIGNHFFSK